MTKTNELNKVLQSHLQTLTDEKRLHGARYRVALCCNIVADGVVGTTKYLVDTQSITKLFTAVAILQMQEKGLLSLQNFWRRMVYMQPCGKFKRVSMRKNEK